MPCLGPDQNNHRELSWLYQKNERATGGTKEPPPAAPAGLTSPHENSPTLYGTPSTADATHPACESRGDSDSKSNSHRTYEEQHQRPFEWACGHASASARSSHSLSSASTVGKCSNTARKWSIVYCTSAAPIVSRTYRATEASLVISPSKAIARCSSIVVS